LSLIIEVREVKVGPIMCFKNKGVIALLVLMLSLFGCSNSSLITDSLLYKSTTVNSHVEAALALGKELKKEYLSGTFNGSILIVSKGQGLVKESYGWADRSINLQNNQNTISDMGSIAKTFTAAAVLQPAAQNKLKLSHPIEHFYPNAPKDKKHLTIEQLLTHSIGLDNFHCDTDFDEMSKNEAIDRILKAPLIAEANKRVIYSNSAYTLLAAIVEKVSGQPLERYIQTNILIPLSLSDTGFYGDSHISAFRLAHGYGGDDSGITTYEKGLTWAFMGQGGMVLL
jgi:CubicO group peptidase (beta-lactamase class C family)